LSYRVGDVLNVRVEKIVPRGFGLCFAERLTILVPLAVPGDELSVRITEIKKRLAFAEIVEIDQAGPHRVVPPCPYFGACGGCNFQQLDYRAQLAAKLGILQDCLRRSAKIDFDPEIPIIPSPQDYAYRSRARWHLDTGTHSVGYFRRDSNNLIDVERCPVLTPGVQSALEYVRENTGWGTLWDDNPQVEAASGEEGCVSMFSAEMSDAPAELSFTSSDAVYHFSAETFFQANKFLIGDLIETAVGALAGATALDLYAGVGLFALPLAKSFAKVIAVEEHPAAARFARKNAYDSGSNNISVVCSSVGAFLREISKDEIDLILLDPPRSGPEPATIKRVTDLQPVDIVYVSCEPSILARDLRVLLDRGYVLQGITALDLFPQTHHVETVVRLQRSVA
jgi:23S rRNA (uracil1939-C5)-methyltransferase